MSNKISYKMVYIAAVCERLEQNQSQKNIIKKRFYQHLHKTNIRTIPYLVHFLLHIFL